MTGSLSGERAALRARRSGSGLGRRSRKVYRITDEGRRQFAELLHSEPVGGNDEARNFSLRLAFARYLPPHARLRLLERRRGQLFQRLAEARAAEAAAAGRLDTYARSLMEHTTESTERDIAWLDRLIEAERDKAEPATAPRAAPAPGPGGQDSSKCSDRSGRRRQRHEHGTGCDRGRGELRQLARPGRRVLPRRAIPRTSCPV